MGDNNNGASGYVGAVALGFVCGLRTMMGPALIAGGAAPGVKLLLRVLAAGELVADKLPKTPDRIATGPLVGRAVSGAIVGAVACRAGQKSPWLGGLLGAAGAVAGAYGGYHARKALAPRVPDPVIAVVEDALAVGLGRRFAPHVG